MKTIDTEISKIRDLISFSKNPIMFFDTDSDGACSYIQLKKKFPQLKKGFPVNKDIESQQRGLNQIKKDHDLIIFFDMPFIVEDFFEKIKDRKAIWVDHHQIFMDKYFDKYENILFFNPLMYNEIDERCSSYWAYKISDMKENLFYVSLASVADFYLLDVLVDLYEYDSKLFNLLFKIPNEKRKQLFRYLKSNDFETVMEDQLRPYWVQYLEFECGHIKFKYFFDLIFKLEKEHSAMKIINKIEKLSPIDFKVELENSKDDFFENFNSILKEYNSVFKKSYDKIKSQESTDLVYVHHANKSISFNRQLAEELVFKVKDYKVMFTSYEKDSSDYVSCSFRGKDYDVNALVRESLKGLQGQGGGHISAAGCIVLKKDFPEFKKRIENKF